MSKSRAKAYSQEAYKTTASASVEPIRKHAARLAEIATLLERAPDFSASTLTLLHAAIQEMETVEKVCKKVREVSIKRGITHFDEQKAALMRGTLKINRRDIQEAAE